MPISGRRIATQPTDIEFTNAPPGAREAVTGIVLDVVDPERIRDAARAYGQPFEGDRPTICGVSVELRAG